MDHLCKYYKEFRPITDIIIIICSGHEKRKLLLTLYKKTEENTYYESKIYLEPKGFYLCNLTL